MKLRTAIVGNRQALNVLLPAFRAVPAFEVTALCGRNQDRVRAAAEQAGVAKTFSEWESLVEEPGIDVVALALPPFLQSRAAVALADAGKHLFCEKPLAANLAEARAVCDAVRKANRTAAVNFGFRMVEAFRDLHAIVRSGVLGRPQFVMVEWILSFRRDPALSWNWKSDASQGGGTLNMMASHPLDYLRWFFGDVVSLRAQNAALVAARPEVGTGRPKPVRADDTCNLVLTLGQDIPASVTISTVLPVPGSHRIRAWFEKGMLELSNSAADDTYDGFSLTFEPAASTEAGLSGDVEKLAALSRMNPCYPGRTGTTQRIVAEFAKQLAGEVGLAPSMEDGLKAQECLEKAREGSLPKAVG